MTSTIQLFLLLCEVIKMVKECEEKRRKKFLPFPPSPSQSLSFPPFSSSVPFPPCHFFQEEEVGEEGEERRGKERRGEEGERKEEEEGGREEVQKVKSTWQWWFAIWECQQRGLDWSISANQHLASFIDVVPVRSVGFL